MKILLFLAFVGLVGYSYLTTQRARTLATELESTEKQISEKESQLRTTQLNLDEAQKQAAEFKAQLDANTAKLAEQEAFQKAEQARQVAQQQAQAAQQQAQAAQQQAAQAAQQPASSLQAGSLGSGTPSQTPTPGHTGDWRFQPGRTGLDQPAQPAGIVNPRKKR
jgi:peptidoglycan hydrolase CwlO-like protein